jgi:hypothetical protein
MEANRLQILFDEIPADDLRAALKSHGFKWSRKNEAWQRQLTRNAIPGRVFPAHGGYRMVH